MAITDERYEELQIMDFLIRLRKEVLPLKPTNYEYAVGEYFQSDLGRATALDHHINRPAFVGSDIGTSLDFFYNKYQKLSKNPWDWGGNRMEYERMIVEYYGNSRRMAKANGASVAPARYLAMKARLI